MARHRVFTIVADIASDASEADLRRLLEVQPETILSDIQQLHFACFVIFEKARLVDEGQPLDGTKSKLVFECNIDGPVDVFLSCVLDHPIVDGIYRHCEGYPQAGARAAKIAFFSRRIKWPNLYHVGAPYRSARAIKADAELRRILDVRLADAMAPYLASHLARSPSATRALRRVDALRPLFAWIVGVSGPVAAVWLARGAWHLPLARPLRIAILGAYAMFAAASIVAAFNMWITSLPELRDRVRPWIQWAVAGTVWLGVAVLIRSRSPRWAIGLAGAYGIVTLQKIGAAVLRRRSGTLQAAANSASPPLGSLWDLLRRHVDRLDEGPAWWEPFWNAKGWAIAYLILVGIAAASTRSTGWLLAVVATLFLLKSVWLAILLGWPADGDGHVAEDRQRIRAFVFAVPVLAAAVFAILTTLSTSPWLLALVMLATLFALWAVPLPSPAPRFTRVAGPALDVLTDDEDKDVQNHMAALVALRRDRPYRPAVLKSFLFLLNHLFFRSWLPDLYRGKLFGITTVHFAQWVLIDDRNYLFLSNYDNSWTTYLDDFGSRLESGIQKIWGQGDKNPGTRDIGRFKHYARTTMVAHSLWCRGYPGLTLRQQWNNERIRRALWRGADDAAMIAALRRFGAAPKTLPDFSHGRIN